MPPSPYELARARARARQHTLLAEQAALIERALLKRIEEIRRLIRTASPSAARALLSSQAMLERQQKELLKDMTEALKEGRGLSFKETLKIWEKAGDAYAEARGIADSDIGRLRAAPISMMQAFEAVSPAQAWVTLRRDAFDSASEASAIFRQAMLEGKTPDAIAKSLRRYVVGSEGIDKIFPKDGEIDLRGLSAAQRGATRRMKFNAERIAFSEMHNARAEAEIQHFINDPFIVAVRWKLSPNRGAQTTPDECDYLASADFYGLGPGVYPVDSVPPPPHPFDRCEREPITRPSSQIGNPKPTPSLLRDPKDSSVSFPRGGRLTPGAMKRARDSADRAITAGQRTPKPTLVPPKQSVTRTPTLEGAGPVGSRLDKDFSARAISPSQKKSLEFYRGTGYNDMNTVLRQHGGDVGDWKLNVPEHYKKEVQSAIKGIDEFLASTSEQVLGQDVVVWRGGVAVEGLVEGMVYQDLGYVSTAIDRSIAETFQVRGKDNISTLYRIRVPKGSRGIDIDKALGKEIRGEQEFILPRGSKFKVRSIEIQETITPGIKGFSKDKVSVRRIVEVDLLP